MVGASQGETWEGFGLAGLGIFQFFSMLGLLGSKLAKLQQGYSQCLAYVH